MLPTQSSFCSCCGCMAALMHTPFELVTMADPVSKPLWAAVVDDEPFACEWLFQ